MEEHLVSRLSPDQIEKICETAEEAARKYVTSRVPKHGILDLTVTVDLEGTEILNVNVDVEVRLSPLFRNMDVEGLVKGSVRAAFEAVEGYLREYKCR